MMTTLNQKEFPQPTRVVDPTRPWYRFVRSLLPEDLEAPSSQSECSARGVRLDPWVDLGCGFGEFLEFANGPENRSIGTDIDLESLAVARSVGHRVVASDLSQGIPFRDGAFSGATLIEVLEHVFETERLLSELSRIIRPGGWLIITTPNVAHLTYRIRAATGHPPKQEGYHLRFFTRDVLQELFDANGFRIEARASYGKQALMTKVSRLPGLSRLLRSAGDTKVRYRVPVVMEPLLAQRFVWRLRRT